MTTVWNEVFLLIHLTLLLVASFRSASAGDMWKHWAAFRKIKFRHQVASHVSVQEASQYSGICSKNHIPKRSGYVGLQVLRKEKARRQRLGLCSKTCIPWAFVFCLLFVLSLIWEFHGQKPQFFYHSCWLFLINRLIILSGNRFQNSIGKYFIIIKTNSNMNIVL